MKFPKELKIGGHKFTVVLKELEKDLGCTDYTKNIITIDINLPQDQKEATLIHEIMHCMNTTLEHQLLDSLSEQMYQVLKDNNLLK